MVSNPQTSVKEVYRLSDKSKKTRLKCLLPVSLNFSYILAQWSGTSEISFSDLACEKNEKTVWIWLKQQFKNSIPIKAQQQISKKMSFKKYCSCDYACQCTAL